MSVRRWSRSKEWAGQEEPVEGKAPGARGVVLRLMWVPPRLLKRGCAMTAGRFAVRSGGLPDRGLSRRTRTDRWRLSGRQAVPYRPPHGGTRSAVLARQRGGEGAASVTRMDAGRQPRAFSGVPQARLPTMQGRLWSRAAPGSVPLGCIPRSRQPYRARTKGRPRRAWAT
jgi:hypothetical protein